MKLYCITYKGKPVRMEKLCRLNGDEPPMHMDNETRRMILADTAKQGLIQQYLMWFGFTWKERPKGVDMVELVPITHFNNPF